MTTRPVPKRVSHVHKLVAETAREMAHAVYDELMKRNDWYDIWKKQNPKLGPKALEARWVALSWPKMVPNARAQLAAMLSHPYDNELKSQIYDALLLDRTLVRGRGLIQ